MSEFTHNLEDLMHIATKKCHLVEHLKKNYREHVHYVVSKVDAGNRHGGHNKIVFMLTQRAHDLLKNSFNLRNRYLVEISDGVKQVNIGMCIENQTIGFIANSFSGVLNMVRQFVLGKYRIDLCIVEHKLAIECDENGHADRDVVNERIREEFIVSSGYKMIRYNPNEPSFDLSNVLKEICNVVFSKG